MREREREKEREKPYHLLWPTLRSHVVALPWSSIDRGRFKVHPGSREHRHNISVDRCQHHMYLEHMKWAIYWCVNLWEIQFASGMKANNNSITLEFQLPIPRNISPLLLQSPHALLWMYQPFSLPFAHLHFPVFCTSFYRFNKCAFMPSHSGFMCSTCVCRVGFHILWIILNAFCISIFSPWPVFLRFLPYCCM